MTSHRTSSLILTLLAVLMACAPSCALAGSLLSGYGGPGEGNQAILGSALLGGPGGGSGSSSTGATGTGAQLGRGHAASTGSTGQGSTTHGAAGGASGSRGGEASGGTARAYPVSSRDSSSQPTSGASEALGVSGEDLGYVLLALGALALTGVLTRRLARASGPEGL
jgi:hypothetical protein